MWSPWRGFLEKGLLSQRGCPERSSTSSLSSFGVVRALQRLVGKPAVAFAYFKDTETISFRHDLATYAEIVCVLSHKGQGRMLFSLFGEILSPADGGGDGPEIVPLMDQIGRMCTNGAVSRRLTTPICLRYVDLTCWSHLSVWLFSGQIGQSVLRVTH